MNASRFRFGRGSARNPAGKFLQDGGVRVTGFAGHGRRRFPRRSAPRNRARRVGARWRYFLSRESGHLRRLPRPAAPTFPGGFHPLRIPGPSPGLQPGKQTQFGRAGGFFSIERKSYFQTAVLPGGGRRRTRTDQEGVLTQFLPRHFEGRGDAACEISFGLHIRSYSVIELHSLRKSL